MKNYTANKIKRPNKNKINKQKESKYKHKITQNKIQYKTNQK
jgi:hypothetical protein